MKGYQVRPRRRLQTASFILSACLLLSTGFAAQSQSNQSLLNQGQGVNLSIRYRLFAGFKDPVHLCTGETRNINVYMYRSMAPIGTPEDRLPFRSRPDARILGLSENPQVAKVLTERETTSSVLGGEAFAIFVVKGEMPGTTRFSFDVADTGDPFEWGGPAHIWLNVEVGDCYEAYASGLNTGNVANEWTEKNICSLQRPFSLSNSGAAQSSGAAMNIKSQNIFFAPANTPLQGVQGAYISIQAVAIQSSGVTFNCELIATGPYDIIWHNNNKTQGDIKLEGIAILTCGGGGRSPGGDTGLLIAIRSLDPATTTDSCDE